MHIRPGTLSFITTYRCTSACDGCCFSCSPSRKEHIPYERMISLMDETAETPSIKSVTFTGGEPFLLGAKLDRLIAYASAQGLTTRCVTNGSWAASAEIAEKRARQLSKLGLDEIKLSTGAVHSAFVPVERVANAARACVAAGIRTTINVESTPETEFSIMEIAGDPGIVDMVEEGRLAIMNNLWISCNHLSGYPAGYSRFIDINKTRCPYCLDTITVTPELDLMACGRLLLKHIPDLTLGSVKEETLGEALSKAPDDIIKQWLRIEGPEKILDFVKLHRPDYRLPVTAVHMCETCNHLYNDRIARTVINECHREIEESIINRYFGEIALKSATTREYYPGIYAQ